MQVIVEDEINMQIILKVIIQFYCDFFGQIGTYPYKIIGHQFLVRTFLFLFRLQDTGELN